MDESLKETLARANAAPRVFPHGFLGKAADAAPPSAKQTGDIIDRLHAVPSDHAPSRLKGARFVGMLPHTADGKIRFPSRMDGLELGIMHGTVAMRYNR